MTKPPPTPTRPARRPGRRLVGAGALLLLAAGLAMASLRRVPAPDLGLSGGSLLRPGLHVVSPLARVRVVAVSGRIGARGIERQTGEGASVTVRLSFLYHLDPVIIEGEARRIALDGIDGAIGR